MEQIHLPNTIEFTDDPSRPNVGTMVVTPCQQGYGTTLGNSLRRVLLSSLPGSAVESIRIDGVQHEFSGLDNVLEDVVEIILNAKQIAVKVFSDEPVVLSLSKKGKGVITAGDFAKNADVEIMNPEQKLMTVTNDKTVINMEISVGKGRGYVPVAEKNIKDLPLGTIAIDSLYTPVRDVGYNVELTRVGDITDYEKLVLKIETNGTVTPQEAVSQASKILLDHFVLVLNMSGGDASEFENLDVAKEVEAKEEVVEEDKTVVAKEEVEEEEEKAAKKTKKKKK